MIAKLFQINDWQEISMPSEKIKKKVLKYKNICYVYYFETQKLKHAAKHFHLPSLLLGPVSPYCWGL